MAELIVIDDEASICWGLKQLGESLGHRVSVFSSVEKAIECDAESADLVLLDVRLPGISGLEGLSQINQKWNSPLTIMMTAYGDLETALAAVDAEVFEYLIKPFDLDQVEATIQRALSIGAEKQPGNLQQVDAAGKNWLIGRSPEMQEVFKQLALAAKSESPVLLSGESGTGKELVARAIHENSARSAGRFVAVNLASLSESVAESELFGHERGAFTGADRKRDGLLAMADGGTLFLDEVAEIPLAFQVKLLRALELKEFIPVGASQPVRADFRIISASHRDLWQSVEAKQFRHDLFYRLSSFSIRIPPLRERQDDIEELARYFVGAGATQNTPAAAEAYISDGALQVLREQTWPGNVRQLRNVVERALILSRGHAIYPEHLSDNVQQDSADGPVDSVNGKPVDFRDLGDDEIVAHFANLVSAWTAKQFELNHDPQELHQALVEALERPLFDWVLKRCKNNYSLAARQLGIHRTTLKKKVETYGID